MAHILVASRRRKAQSIYEQLRGVRASQRWRRSTRRTPAPQFRAAISAYSPRRARAAVLQGRVRAEDGDDLEARPSQFGWHIIKALGPVIPASTSPFSKEKAGIVQQLQQAKNSSATADFQAKVEKYYKNRVKYAKAYAPPETTTPPATGLTPTTATG